MVPPRILTWDLETTDLLADFGTILCAGYKWYGKREVHVLSLLDFPKIFGVDPTNDSRLVRAFYNVLAQADVWVTWYGERFDARMFNAKLMEHRLRPLPHIQHIDLWKTAKYQMKLSSNRLKNVCAYLDLPEKTPVLGKVWRRARTGHGPSVRYVIEHCRQDVKVLEMAYERMRPWVHAHPHLGLIAGLRDACPHCGMEGKLRRRGVMYTKVRVYQRFQCQHCGAWSRARLREQDWEVENV